MYTLPLKHTQWVCEDLEMLEKAELFHRMSFLDKSYCYSTKEISTRRTTSKCLYADYHALNSLLPLVVKAHSKAHFLSASSKT